ncbi:hypothetical protein [Flavobacterium sp.]|jgi:hypothetical protein|uniref:hypothetical protein n=1 Tax=Flavobacterium sp. TaxID=239 RepID=UPI003BE9372D
MKKFTILLAVFGLLSFQSCTVHETTPINTKDNDTISEVWEFNRSFTTTNNFSNLITFPHTIYVTDMVLVYRLAGIDNGANVWKLLPETYFTSNGALDFRYNFDFTNYNVNIFMDGFDLAGVSNAFRINQVLRVVVIPGFRGNKYVNAVDLNDYYAVLNAYNINPNKVLKIK